jgi:hypothetical protein
MKPREQAPPAVPKESLEALLKRDLEAWILAKAAIEAARRR